MEMVSFSSGSESRMRMRRGDMLRKRIPNRSMRNTLDHRILHGQVATIEDGSLDCLFGLFLIWGRRSKFLFSRALVMCFTVCTPFSFAYFV